LGKAYTYLREEIAALDILREQHGELLQQTGHRYYH